ncbi:hypothetical protein [Helicobacter sp. MIT 99-5507]|uniref:hypothetical protein n=1 Tax=Helicobacter sp. MIT 99-5507 TaxID=152489 RepID=UPI000E1EEA52|nr:hypothetical protein [Helicobacter sp. MIT 99-5507]RDU57575.1 hypothetical protein CQA42_06570 [Helicobacter sp. MIT 99-5507]
MPKIINEKISIIDKIRLYKPYIIAAIVVIGIFIYIFILLFGNKSLFVLLELKEEQKELQKSVQFYQKQNAYLQKEIFEIAGE